MKITRRQLRQIIKEAFAGDKGKLGSALAYGTLGLTGGPAGMIAGATYGYQKELT